jgi:hypothetical protein
MRETEKDFKKGDSFVTDWEYHQDGARDDMYKHAECIAQDVQHHINNNCLTLEIDNIDVVYKAIEQIKELSYYTYVGDRQGRWNKEYSEEFEFNFKAEVVGLLSDELGYIWEEKS